ncbi:hypothetical protein [Alkalihalobacillus sp. BA299]|uniref:hypothetical protein n=1 Tax=Alkalihalobacillus sp. BA299 TaxID=2815938 RepID=UPI001ADD2FF7|nr:hypothetical protein [Alkalihalobacillus sp. BA299]
MEKKTLLVQHKFYMESPYAKHIMKEEHDGSYGLIYDEFIHEMGTLLEVDIIFNRLNEKNWLIADNRHMQITYQKDAENNDQYDFIPKTNNGDKLIQEMIEKLLQSNNKFISFHSKSDRH